jgi:hypothetical protein
MAASLQKLAGHVGDVVAIPSANPNKTSPQAFVPGSKVTIVFRQTKSAMQINNLHPIR